VDGIRVAKAARRAVNAMLHHVDRRSRPTQPAELAIEPIIPEYPLDVRSRYGYDRPPISEIADLFERSRDEYIRRLTSFGEHIPLLARIPDHPTGPTEPCWVNIWFTGLDAVALYATLVERNPRIFLEVGSGHSTRFARQAIRDHGLRTHIVSIDPAPRWDVSAVSDEVITAPFQDVDPKRLPTLGENDVFFFDGTHYVFSNTDTTAALLETLPNVKSGALLHFHDIFLPWDYPPEWRDRYYNEQFVIAAYLLAGGLIDVLLPSYYCVRDPELHSILEPLWRVLIRQGAATNGSSLWLVRR
jgi:hypothetical protein